MNELDASAAAWLRLMRSAPNYFTALNELREDLDVNVCAADGVTALHIAAELGAMDKVVYLLEDGADTMLRDARGRTPRMVAHLFRKVEVVNCLTLHDEIVRELTEQLERKPTWEDIGFAKNFDEFRGFRAKIQQRIEARSTKLVEAARQGDLNAVRAMVGSGEVHVDESLQSTGETAFSAALSSGRYRICKYLLECGAHTDACCIVGGVNQSTMVTAVRGGDADFVRLLASTGASLWSPSQDAETCALAEAAMKGSLRMIDTLLEFDAVLRASRNGLGLEAADVFDEEHLVSADARLWVLFGIACWLQNRQLIDHLLSTRPVLQEEMAKNGANALSLAVLQENEEIASMLLDMGVPINQRIYEGDKSALLAAVSINSVRMLQFLIDRGADVEPTYSSIAAGFGGSLLSFAVQSGAMECARLLLPLERRPQQRDKALANAARRDDVEFAVLMLDQALPSTENAFLACVGSSTSPIMLNLMLSRCCASAYPISLYCSKFAFSISLNISTDVISVLLAHGLDIIHDLAPTLPSYALSPLVDSLISGLTVGGNDRILDVLVKNGVPVVGVNKEGKTAEQILEERLKGKLQKPVRTALEACGRLLSRTSC